MLSRMFVSPGEQESEEESEFEPSDSDDSEEEDSDSDEDFSEDEDDDSDFSEEEDDDSDEDDWDELERQAAEGTEASVEFYFYVHVARESFCLCHGPRALIGI